MRRGCYWAAVVVAVSAVVGGGTYAYVGYRAASGPDAAVTGYFAALARSDAPAALGYGEVPDGQHELLTSDVLAEQQRIAPLRDVRILDVVRTRDDAAVRYSYQLHFAGGVQDVTGSLRVVRRGGGWRLISTAIATTVRLDQARDRVAFAGSSLPRGTTELFPGALPVRIDTPFLQLDPATAAVRFGDSTTTDITLEPTATARAALIASLGRQLTTCVSTPTVAASCPLPSSRVVPGSLAGRLIGGLNRKIVFGVGSEAAGTITMTGTLMFDGSYRTLDFENIAQQRTGRLTFKVLARASAVAPLTVRLQSTA